jgi:hypothetical protein
MNRRNFIVGAVAVVGAGSALAVALPERPPKGVISYGNSGGVIGVRLCGKKSHHEVLQRAFDLSAKTGGTVVIEGQTIYLDKSVVISEGVKCKITNNIFIMNGGKFYAPNVGSADRLARQLANANHVKT